MSRVPIRVRLTAAFALAMALVLAGAGLFVYVRLKSDLDESVTAGLAARAAAVLAANSSAAGAAGDSEEGFAQRLAPDGRVLDSAGGVRGEVLSRAELRRVAAGEPLLVERDLPGVEATARVLARANGSELVVVGQSLDDRDETLGNLVASFAIGGPVAVVVASLLGYALAAAGLRPVEAMRRRAQDVSLSRRNEKLPLPAAHDEIRRLGQTLNEMLDRLRRSFERERRFVADASHELRTPLAVIKTELEGALRAGNHDPQVREALLACLEECDHLTQLAEDLLIIARAGDGKLPIRPEPLELRALLDRVAARFADRAHQRGRTSRSTPTTDGSFTPTSYACAKPSATSSTTRCATAREKSCCGRVAPGPGYGSRCQITATGSRPTSPRTPLSASPAATAPAPATAAPASASQSCAQSPRRTAATPKSPAPQRRSGSGYPTTPKPPQGHLSLAA